jgi:hypothetical protein
VRSLSRPPRRPSCANFRAARTAATPCPPPAGARAGMDETDLRPRASRQRVVHIEPTARTGSTAASPPP